MSDNDGVGLVIRRTTEEDGNKVAVRLASEVDRTVDLHEVIREGFIIEVLDSELTSTDKTEVTLRFQAPQHFRIDRIEKVCKPRQKWEIGAEEIVAFQIKHKDEVKELDSDEIEDYLIDLREAESKLRAQVVRLKRDKSIASERGYRHRNNDHYHRWIMINEEMDIVNEQLDLVQKAYQSANAIKKLKMQALAERRRHDFQSEFIRLARETLPAKDYEALREKADALVVREDKEVS